MVQCAKFAGKEIKDCTRGEHKKGVSIGCICKHEEDIKNESKRANNVTARPRP